MGLLDKLTDAASKHSGGSGQHSGGSGRPGKSEKDEDMLDKGKESPLSK